MKTGAKTINKTQLVGLSADYLQKNRGEAAAIMRKHGVNVASNATQREVDAAFASLLPRSAAFRKDFSAAISNQLSGYMNASGDARKSLAKKVNARIVAKERAVNGGYCPSRCDINSNRMFSADGVADDLNYVNEDFFNGAGIEDGTAPASNTDSDSKTTKQKGAWLKSVGAFLGGVFTPEQVQKTLNTGLEVWASSKMGGVNGVNNISNELNTSRGQIVTVADNAPKSMSADNAPKSMSTATWVVIGLTGVAILGTIIYVLVKKKK